MTWTPDSPPPCPCCGTRLVERTEPDGGEEGGMLYAYDCPACRWEDAGSYDYQRLTVAAAPWTRGVWAEVELTRGERDALAARDPLVHNYLLLAAMERAGLAYDFATTDEGIALQAAATIDTLAARVRELEAPGECQSVHKLRAALAALVEAVADAGPVTATVAPAWDRACAVLSAGWREGQEVTR